MIDLFPPDATTRSSRTPADAARTCVTTVTCSTTIRRMPARAHAWDAKVRDVHEWLARSDAARRAPAPFAAATTVTYHESCHLAHGQKITTQPRSLLRLLPDVTLVELPESHWCCGSAGIYTITQPEQADLLLQRKVATSHDARPTVVATGNPGLPVCRSRAASLRQARGRASHIRCLCSRVPIGASRRKSVAEAMLPAAIRF